MGKQTTLFMLVSALMGLETIHQAYRHAIKEGYRFNSYGDSKTGRSCLPRAYWPNFRTEYPAPRIAILSIFFNMVKVAVSCEPLSPVSSRFPPRNSRFWVDLTGISSKA